MRGGQPGEEEPGANPPDRVKPQLRLDARSGLTGGRNRLAAKEHRGGAGNNGDDREDVERPLKSPDRAALTHSLSMGEHAAAKAGLLGLARTLPWDAG